MESESGNALLCNNLRSLEFQSDSNDLLSNNVAQGEVKLGRICRSERLTLEYNNNNNKNKGDITSLG